MRPRPSDAEPDDGAAADVPDEAEPVPDAAAAGEPNRGVVAAPGTDDPDVDEPDGGAVDEPDADDPDVAEPDVGEPGVDEPEGAAADEPDADGPELEGVLAPLPVEDDQAPGDQEPPASDQTAGRPPASPTATRWLP